MPGASFDGDRLQFSAHGMQTFVPVERDVKSLGRKQKTPAFHMARTPAHGVLIFLDHNAQSS